MPIQYRRFVRSALERHLAPEVDRVDAVATALQVALEQSEDDLARAHVFGAQSKTIQDLGARHLSTVGFREEVVLTPQDGFVTRARPDFYLRLTDGRGIIAEVERGGAVNNNHDLKDMWKAHIAPDAHHLFLVVAVSNWAGTGSPREKPFARVAHRYAPSSAMPVARWTCSAHVFDYGGTTMWTEKQP